MVVFVVVVFVAVDFVVVVFVLVVVVSVTILIINIIITIISPSLEKYEMNWTSPRGLARQEYRQDDITTYRLDRPRLWLSEKGHYAVDVKFLILLTCCCQMKGEVPWPALKAADYPHHVHLSLAHTQHVQDPAFMSCQAGKGRAE